MKVVIFDIWGDYAHFRRFYTTSSPLTYSFPPPTAIKGIVGAVLGMGKEEYILKTADLYVGVQVLKPVKRIRWGQNIIYTKKGDKFDPTLLKEKPRTQIRVEYLKSPHFRIFVGGPEGIVKTLGDLLREHRTHYTISLGLSELIADFSYVGEVEAQPLSAGTYRILTVFPVDIVDDLGEAIEDGIRLLKERVPIYLAPDRTPLLYQDVIVEANGRPVRVKVKEGVYKLEKEGVAYLWPPASTHIRASS